MLGLIVCGSFVVPLVLLFIDHWSRFDEPSARSELVVLEPDSDTSSRSLTLEFPSWWINPRSNTVHAGIGVQRGPAKALIARTLYDGGHSVAVSCAAACLTSSGLSAALHWISGSVPVELHGLSTPVLPAQLTSDDPVRSMLAELGCTPADISRAYEANVSRDVSVLFDWIVCNPGTGAAEPTAAVPSDFSGDVDEFEVFPVDGVPSDFMDRYVGGILERRPEGFDIEKVRLEAANTWYLKVHLVGLGYNEHVAMLGARQANNRRAAEMVALAEAGPPPNRRRTSDTPFASPDPPTPGFRGNDAMQSSLSSLLRALGVMKQSGANHPLIARILYDAMESLPFENCAFEGFAVVYGCRLLLEAAAIYEVGTHSSCLFVLTTCLPSFLAATVWSEECRACPDAVGNQWCGQACQSASRSTDRTGGT